MGDDSVVGAGLPDPPAAGDDLDGMTVGDAGAELARLAGLLGEANDAYHRRDAPVMTDAAYDALKRRNAAIEARLRSA